MIDFSKVQYTISAHLASQMPPDDGAEVAFAGRSNVGKSSAINTITNVGGLAKTSKTPGRTRQINFFDLGNSLRLVDLPGYGYARVPAKMRDHWRTFLTSYLSDRQSLAGLILPMDIRRPLTGLDRTMLEVCWQSDHHVHILLTKSDKLGRGKAMAELQAVLGQMAEQPRTTVQLFSSLEKQGVEEARKMISHLLLNPSI